MGRHFLKRVRTVRSGDHRVIKPLNAVGRLSDFGCDLTSVNTGRPAISGIKSPKDKGAVGERRMSRETIFGRAAAIWTAAIAPIEDQARTIPSFSEAKDVGCKV